jgi:tRNA threonylcarbamoyladenosine biosynthesis protein TsaE
MYTIYLENENITQDIGQAFSTCLVTPLVVTFAGEIGAGKTTFIRALIRALGYTSTIKSPTFSIVESYQTSAFLLHHFDLYRMQTEDELDYIGFRDYFTDTAICLIEWPERAEETLAGADISITLELKGTGRVLQWSANTWHGEQVAQDFFKKTQSLSLAG